jgi:ATP-binding cassette subfamily F protein 3
MRNILAGFLFTGDMVFQETASLSGGERAKLVLLKTVLSGANTLLLDEPTNHMDIPSREAIEDALLTFTGTLLIVSHDRYFLGKVPTRIVELTDEGLVSYPGNYDYFMEKKAQTGSGRKYLKGLLQSESAADTDAESERLMTDAAEERLRKKRDETERRRREKQRDALEAEIARLEAAAAAVQADIGRAEIYADPEKLTLKAKELDELKDALDTAYEQWYGM